MSFVYQIKEYPIRSLKTCLLGLIFIGIGLFIATPGPALLDLQIVAHTTFAKTAILLPARSIGFAVGCVIGGILGDWVDHQLVLIISLVASIVTTYLFPLFANIYAMYAFIMQAGIANGCMNTVGNCWIIHIWGNFNPPFLQLINLFYGLGAFCAPFIVEPFLINKETDNTTSKNLIGASEDVMIHWTFIITASFYLLVLILFIIVYICYPENLIHPSRAQIAVDVNAIKDEFKLNSPIEGYLRTIVIFIATLAVHAYFGLEISFGSFLSPFAVKSNLRMGKSEGSFLTSAFWGFYTIFRLISLVAIIYVSARMLLLINYGIILFSNFILLPFGNHYRWALWIGSSLMGVGCSSIFSNLFTFLEQLTPISARITAAFLIADI